MSCCRYRPLFLLALCVLILPTLALAGDGSSEIQNQTNVDLLTEGFESFSFPPVGWEKIHVGTSYSWSRTSTASNTGSASAYVRNGSASSTQDEYLVTPALDFSFNLMPRLGWYEEEANWDTRGGTHYIMVSTTSQTDPSTFEVVAEMTPENHTIGGFGGPQIEVDLSAYAGEPTVYVAFRYVGSYADYWFVDDVKVFELVGAGGDVTPIAVSPSGQSYEDGDIFTPQVEAYNNGTETADFEVTLEILESGNVVYTESQMVTGLASDTTQNLSFPDFTVTAGNLIELRATTNMDGDQIPANDSRSVYNTAYTQPHVPMGLLFTNAGCGPCVSANQTLDSIYPQYGNDAGLARIHVWWPGADGIYNANTAQASSMVTEYGVGGVPAMFIDGVDAGSSTNFASLYTAGMALKSPLNIELVFNDETDELTVDVNVLEMMRPIQNLKLYAYITEDNVYYAGGNGETRHHQAMRYIYPNTTGLDVGTALGTQRFTLDTPLNGTWEYDKLRATVYLQDKDTGEMIQAGTDFLSNIDDITSAVGDQVTAARHLNANYPNPFNPSTKISFSLPVTEQAELSIYSLDGKLVKTLVSESLASGSHEVTWTGKDASGASVASGAYFYRLRTPSFSETRVMTLIK